MIKIESVWIEWIVDEFPDVSYLDTDAEYYYGKDGSDWDHISAEVMREVIEEHGSILNACEHYAKEDRERLFAYYRNEWYMTGCITHATVRVPVGKYFRIHKFSSGGLWGIESDSSTDYLAQVEGEELDDLKNYLEQFGVDTPDFETWRAECLS